MIETHHASMLDYLAAYDGPLFDSCVTDPPYHLASIVARFGKEGSAAAKVPEGGTGAYARASRGFMGKEWDGGDIAFRPETWRAVYDALKPGAHLVAFSGTRTYHRMACAIEDAGFEIRDQLAWVYGSGFPKSHDISKAIDKAAGVEREKIRVTNPRNPKASGGGRDGQKGATRPWIEKAMEVGFHEKDGDKPATAEAAQWQGWGTAIKPAWEPICLARKPLSEKTVAANVLKHGTGAINIDGCRVEGIKPQVTQGINSNPTSFNVAKERRVSGAPTEGRFPANIIHDGSDEVLAEFPETASGKMAAGTIRQNQSGFTGNMPTQTASDTPGDSGSAARFFYSAKAGPLDRLGSEHATIKPVDLMRWLCRLVTPTGGRILEPFAGSGTTGIAAMVEGFDCTMIEMESDHVADIERKLAHLRGEGVSSIEMHKKRKAKPIETLEGLFARDAT